MPEITEQPKNEQTTEKPDLDSGGIKIFKPLGLKEQIEKLSQAFGVQYPNGNLPDIDIPSASNGVIAIVNPNAIKDDYSRALQTSTEVIVNGSGRLIQNDLESGIIDHFVPDNFVQQCIDECHHFGDFIIVPVSIRKKWAGMSPKKVYDILTSNSVHAKSGEYMEFPLRLFDGMCALISHGNEMIDSNRYSLRFAGDNFNPIPSRDHSAVIYNREGTPVLSSIPGENVPYSESIRPTTTVMTGFLKM